MRAEDRLFGLRDVCRRIGNLFGWYIRRAAVVVRRSTETSSSQESRRLCTALYFEAERKQRGIFLALLAPSRRILWNQSLSLKL